MLVNALSVVKSYYFYMKFSRLIQITKPVKSPKNRVRKINGYCQYTVTSENILLSILRKKAGAALVRTITNYVTITTVISSR